MRVSRDGGHTWTPLAPVPGPYPLGRAQFLDSRTGFVVGRFGRQLWRTTDGGNSWTPTPAPGRGQGAPPRFDHVEFWTPIAGVAVARGFGGGYLTTSGGRNWKRLAVPGAQLGPLQGPFGLASDLRGGYPELDYACFAAGGAGWVVTITEPPAVFASTDGGGAAGRADYLFSCAACRDTERRGMVLTRRGRLDGRSVSALCLSGLVVQLPLLKLVAFSDCARLRIGRARPRRRPDARGLHESVLLHNGSAVRPCRLPAK